MACMECVLWEQKTGNWPGTRRSRVLYSGTSRFRALKIRLRRQKIMCATHWANRIAVDFQLKNFKLFWLQETNRTEGLSSSMMWTPGRDTKCQTEKARYQSIGKAELYEEKKYQRCSGYRSHSILDQEADPRKQVELYHHHESRSASNSLLTSARNQVNELLSNIFQWIKISGRISRDCGRERRKLLWDPEGRMKRNIGLSYCFLISLWKNSPHAIERENRAFYPLYKNDYSGSPSIYSPICLLSSLRKVIERALDRKMQAHYVPNAT